MRKNGDFEIVAPATGCNARLARLVTTHGTVETPVFMPVGTQATVKTLAPDELADLGVRMVLGNTYHLCIRPGINVIERCGGLHRFMGWNGPILTDSGGLQVFSLSDLRRVQDDGVQFHSHVDGRPLFLGPAEAMAYQARLGSDIAMAFDECIPYPCDRDYACQAVDKTLRWAALCAEKGRICGRQLVFGIVQGGTHADLRGRCARELVAIGFDGYAIGGVSVGEPNEVLEQGIRDSVMHLPPARPRYLMGVGRMDQILRAVAMGVDMFDCVMPTRCARNGTAFTRYGHYAVKGGEFREDVRPIEEGCECYACAHFSRAYVRHLLNVDEVLGIRLLTVHNVWKYMEFMESIRAALQGNCFEDFASDYLRRFHREPRPES